MPLPPAYLPEDDSVRADGEGCLKEVSDRHFGRAARFCSCRLNANRCPCPIRISEVSSSQKFVRPRDELSDNVQ